MKNKVVHIAWTVSLFGFFLLRAGKAVAGVEDQVADFATKPVTLILALAAFSLIPFVLMTATSYVKISIVLNILRNALGAQQVPPASVISAIAIILTLYVMFPTIELCRQKAEPLLNESGQGDLLSRQNAARLIETAEAVKGPIKDFLRKNSSVSSIKMFLSLARSKMTGDIKGKKPALENDLRVLLPSFLITELQEAFFIGFLMFLPFLIIELVISNILLSLGMHMLSPTTISLPFKLLLFVSVSGWEILSKGLIMGYS